MPYVGAEALLVAWIKATLDVRTVTDAPADLADVVPLYRVQRIGGGSHDDNPRFDLPTVAIDSFGATRIDATNLAIELDDALRLQLPGSTTGGAVVTRVETVTGPHWAPWDDTSLRRFNSVYRLHVKRLP